RLGQTRTVPSVTEPPVPPVGSFGLPYDLEGDRSDTWSAPQRREATLSAAPRSPQKGLPRAGRPDSRARLGGFPRIQRRPVESRARARAPSNATSWARGYGRARGPPTP